MNDHLSTDGAIVRAELIATGAIRPADDRPLTPWRSTGQPVLRLDDWGRAVAAKRIASLGDGGCGNPWVASLSWPPSPELDDQETEG